MYGEKLDISIFWFQWFAPVWYYDPRKSFPLDKMEKGYHLSIVHNVGDTFLYIIIPSVKLDKYEKRKRHRPQTLVRSVVRHRLPTQLHTPTCKETCDGYEFYDYLVSWLTQINCDTLVSPCKTIHTVVIHSLLNVWIGIWCSNS